MSKLCQLSGKKPNNGYSVSHSNIKTKRKQNVNLQNKKVWSISQSKWIKLKISVKSIKGQHKNKI
uniref:Large ribosomal subunit protein bL28c n=1 Tax=Neogoniolithon spectabile TaxID=231755 RepID=A0A3G3MGX8_9FLOR|nr:ribosomal protein L28 [Neogoniolithon spectabile]AYR06098.1 ribosomal protein L28 [Neogoniolithon spectabile]